MGPGIGVRWTIGDLKPRGFEALRLSILGAWRLFGTQATYAVCVHGLPIPEVRRRVGPVPPAVAWIDSSPGWSRSLVPPRLFLDRCEIALDPSVILWERPAALEAWLREAHPRRALLADDQARAFEQFDGVCGPRPCSTSIRGVPLGFDLAQVFALSRETAPRLVSLSDVTVCSPLTPHTRDLGRCGANFVGVGRSLDESVAEHWDRHRPELYRRLDAGLPLVPLAL